MFKSRKVKKPGEGAVARRKRSLPSSEGSEHEESKFDLEDQNKKRIKSGFNHPSRDVRHDLATNRSKSTSTADVESNAEEEKIANGKASKISVKPPPANVKMTTITDFQPDICKDFWQTGYCGYGDTCKFLHIRDELKQLRPIKKEWEDVIKKNRSSDTRDRPLEDNIPYRCVLCKKDYKNPVKTLCDHLFCQSCFLGRFKKARKSKCYICGKETEGICTPVLASEMQKLLA